MTLKKTPTFLSLYILLLLEIILSFSTKIVANVIDFDSDRWEIGHAKITEYLGRKALIGTAYLKDVAFENGTIEVDVAVTGDRSYPGITFRIKYGGNYEKLYIRPHRAGLYPDALQYSPDFNNQGCWQLYNGDGYTAGASIPTNQWIHLKLEISGTQARLFINNAPEPALKIYKLEQGVCKGTIGVSGPGDGSAYFSNFEYSLNDPPPFPEPPQKEIPINMIKQWEISQSIPATQIDLSKIPYPRFFQIFDLAWRTVEAEETGLINISRYTPRINMAPDGVYARAMISSDKKQVAKLSFGYSDEISIFVNGKKLFYGNSSYRYRDPSFLGIIGLYDEIYVPLENGLNEIFLVVKETFGGWGFMFQSDFPLQYPIKDYTRLKRIWQTPGKFLTPESVCYDAKRQILYISNFDSKFKMSATPDEYTGFISKVTMDGKIDNLKWITGLHAPSGMTVYKDKLYVVERRNLVEIDIKNNRIQNRYPIEGADFLNDIVVDSNGNFYITDTTISKNTQCKIIKFKKGKSEIWYSNEQLIRPNGLYLKNQQLLVGNSGGGNLLSINLNTKQSQVITNLGAWVIDGIGTTLKNDYLVSHWQGVVYIISPEGKITEILNTREDLMNSADFEFIKDRNLLIIPTYNGNRIKAYQLLPEE